MMEPVSIAAVLGAFALGGLVGSVIGRSKAFAATDADIQTLELELSEERKLAEAQRKLAVRRFADQHQAIYQRDKAKRVLRELDKLCGIAQGQIKELLDGYDRDAKRLADQQKEAAKVNDKTTAQPGELVYVGTKTLPFGSYLAAAPKAKVWEPNPQLPQDAVAGPKIEMRHDDRVAGPKPASVKVDPNWPKPTAAINAQPDGAKA